MGIAQDDEMPAGSLRQGGSGHEQEKQGEQQRNDPPARREEFPRKGPSQ
jgi:hypothetical protein